MSAQKHIIKRQRIELTLPGRTHAAAGQLQSDISRIYREQVIPLLDEICSRTGDANTLYRIDSLELNLGSLDPAKLAAQFVTQVKAQLPSSLAAEVGRLNNQGAAIRLSNNAKTSTSKQPAPTSLTESALELLSIFLRQGRLPWWADAQQPKLFNQQLAELINNNPAALTSLLQALLSHSSAYARLISHCDDGELARLSALLAPAHQQDCVVYLPELLSSLRQSLASPARSRIRPLFWRTSLEIAVLGGSDYATPTAFYRGILDRVAPLLGVPRASLPNDNIDADKNSANVSGQLQRESQAQTPAIEKTQNRPSRLDRLVQQLRSRGGNLTEFWYLLRTSATQLNPAAEANWLNILASINTPKGIAFAGLQHHATRAIFQLLQAAPTEHGLTPASCNRLLQCIRRDSAATKVTQQADTDDLSIHNAGLIILWPFLTQFFERLGLLENRDFVDLSARQRALGLLQYLATGQTDLPEYLLPLNKLLCGLDLDHPFELDEPLTTDEQEQAEGLLEAMIAQAPSLNNISNNGLRGSFLLRAGLLKRLDTFWLLRIEPQAYDIVLGRLPWSWGWVKLPWMELPLRVEWSN